MGLPIAQVGADFHDLLLVMLDNPIPYEMVGGIQLELPVLFGCLEGEDPGVVFGCRQVAFEAGGTLIPDSHGYLISLSVNLLGSLWIPDWYPIGA